MRKLSILLFLCLGTCVSLYAQQHASVVISAPPAVAHAMPVARASPSHAAPGHARAQNHSGNHVAPSRRAPVASHGAWNQPIRASATNVLGGAVNSVSSPHGAPSCNKPRGVPLQGLNVCPPPSTGVTLPGFGGAIYIPIPYYVESGSQEQEDVQEEASNQQPETSLEETDQERPAAAPSRSNLNDIDEALSEFVFVQRDGGKLYAVAYSFVNDKLTYVTKEGVRRSVALDSLDVDATETANEELGNTINFPNVVIQPNRFVFGVS